MNSSECSAVWTTVIQTYTSLIYSAVIVMFCVALYLQFRLRNTFHPFFSLLFAEAMFMYAACDFCVVTLKIIYSLELSELPVAYVFDQIYSYTYAMIMPLQLCCLLERLAATIYIKSYEENRKWHLLVLSQPFCIAFIFANNHIKEVFENGTLALFFLSYYTIQIMGLLALFQINRFMIKRYTGYGVKLSVRYQLSENIRTIRVFLPMITSDSLISLVDIAYHYLELDYVFEPERCAHDPLYLRLYVSIVGIASAIELVGATLVTFMYPSVKVPCRRKRNLESVPVTNVLGSDLIIKQKERNHFVDLDRLWELRTRFSYGHHISKFAWNKTM